MERTLLGQLRLLSATAPTLAARVAEGLFLRTRRSPPRAGERAVLARGAVCRVRRGDQWLRAWIWGNGPTVLLVHGWNGRAGQLAEFVPPLLEAGFQVVALFNRHLHRGERLVKHFGRSASHMDLKARPWHESVIEAELAKTDILINASAMGRDPEETPIPGELLPPDILVMDLHVVPEETRLLREAREAGATKAMNGDVMLLEQTAAAFTLWTGEKAPLDVIKKTLKSARNKPDVPVPSAEEQANDEGAAEASA